jgi:hypothetical protein
MVRGIAREGKMVFKAQMVMKGDTIAIARTKSPKRMIEDVFIVRSIKELKETSRTHPHGIVSETVREVQDSINHLVNVLILVIDLINTPINEIHIQIHFDLR